MAETGGKAMQAGIPAWASLLLSIVGGTGLLGGLVAWWRSQRDVRLLEAKDGREAQKDGVEIVTQWREEYAALNSETAQLRRDLASNRRDVDSLLDRVETLENEVRALETERDVAISDKVHLVGYVTVVIAGIEAGSVPPLPPMPPTVASILSRITHKEQP